jgi:uncharacterized protein YbaP (TraB family)
MTSKFSILAILILSTFKIIYAQSSVWKLEGENSTVYIGGTIHILREADYPLPLEYEKAFKVADELVFETNIDGMSDPSIASEMMKKLTYGGDKTLKSELSDAAYTELIKEAKDMNVSVNRMQKFKPSMVLLTLTIQALKEMGAKEEGVDKYYDIHGKLQGKKISALESIEFQMNLITSLGDGRESEYVLSSLKDFKGLKRDFMKIISAWKKGEIKYFVKQLKEMKRDYPAMYKSMFLERNNNWIPIIEEHLADKETEFVLVGNLHLHGEKGVLNLLKKKGYKISQVNVSNEESRLLLLERTKREKALSTPVMDEWEVVSGETSGFTALAPGGVKVSSQNVPSEFGDLKMDMYPYSPVPGDDNLMYMIIHSVYPEGSISSDSLEKINDFFDNAITRTVSKVKGKVISQKKLTINEYPGREVLIDYNNGMFIIALRIYLVKNKVYMLQVISETSKVGNESSKRFMESFKLIQK